MSGPAMKILTGQCLGVMLAPSFGPRSAENADEFGPYAFRFATYLCELAAGLRLKFHTRQPSRLFPGQ